MKKLLIRIGDTFEHLGFLIDERVATMYPRKGYLHLYKLGRQERSQMDPTMSMLGGNSLFGSGV